MVLPLFLFAAAAAAATPATGPVGITDTPCPASLEFPAELQAWRAKVYASGNQKMLPPPVAAATAYRNAYTEARKTDWADLCHFRAENRKLAARPQIERDVVFIGDSITEGWLYGDPAFFIRGRVDRGISGQTTPQMLLRFPSDVLALHPRVVHIMAGTNDIAGNTGPTTLDIVESNIAAMVVLAKAADIHVVLAATPPTDTFTWAPNLKPAVDIAELNRRLKVLAARERVTFVDYGSVLATPKGAMKPEFTLDGVHPNAAGYMALAHLATKAIAGADR